MRFSQRVSITSSTGNHIRYIPAALAGAMVAGGSALPATSQGKIREVALVSAASSHAQRTGEPSSAQAPGIRFFRWVRLDRSASRIVEHHPRCLYE